MTAVLLKTPPEAPIQEPQREASGVARPLTGIALGLIHLGACAAFIPAFFSWSGVLVAVALYYLTGAIGVCLGFHRLLTHRSFSVPRPLEYLITTIGVLALQGGPIKWIATHRAHHAFSDTERDPHDSNRGFLWCHVEWLYRSNPARLSPLEQRRYAPDLAADPYYRFLNKTTLLWQIALGVTLFALGSWSWVVWGIFVRLVFTYHVTWFVNSAAHLSGYRTYRTPGQDQSTNNWWVAFLAWGEGWHNNHHAFPFSARHGLRRIEWDATWLLIRVLKALRIASDVKLPTAEMMLRRKFENVAAKAG
ncbi:MAG TPA: fatty acid desaturase [Candidatus Baltobacteraceae bacterium]|jgi:stearoyl-CoA desaturase (delta-9 desaturase)|nr:fatty acid desaturase [Candidatus Baltobacteraceae bacterium]